MLLPALIFMKDLSADQRNKITTASSFQDKPNFHCLSSNLHWHAVYCLLLCLLIKRYHEIISAYKLELSRRKIFSLYFQVLNISKFCSMAILRTLQFSWVAEEHHNKHSLLFHLFLTEANYKLKSSLCI